MEKNPLTVVRDKATLDAALRNSFYTGRSVGFVPTMGALHNGHLSLIAQSRRLARTTVASVFVNPTQFAPGEDLDTYPRSEALDLERLESAGCDIAYLPRLDEIYPTGSVTDVSVPGLSDVLDGVHRPHFFYGVTTVVARLFTHVRPDYALFGEKDYQQLQIIKRMVKDLGMGLKVIGVATLRENDGLAFSSRNAYLTGEERLIAAKLFETLSSAKTRLENGHTAVNAVLEEACSTLIDAGFSSVDYISAVDGDTLEPLGSEQRTWPTEARLLGAAWLGKTRLIDNLPLLLS